MKRTIKQKLGKAYSTLIVEGNSSETKKTIKVQLKKISTKTRRNKAKPYLIIFYFKNGDISVSPPRPRRRHNQKQSIDNSHDIETLSNSSLHDHASSIDRESSNGIMEDLDLLNINADNISPNTKENIDKSNIQIYNINNLASKDLVPDSNQLKDIILSINGFSSNDNSLLDDIVVPDNDILPDINQLDDNNIVLDNDMSLNINQIDDNNVVQSDDDTKNGNSSTSPGIIIELEKKRHEVKQEFDYLIEQAWFELKKVSGKIDDLMLMKNKRDKEILNKINEEKRQ